MGALFWGVVEKREKKVSGFRERHQHPTTNTQRPTTNGETVISLLEVGRWVLDVQIP
jgi:hypothetical protein